MAVRPDNRPIGVFDSGLGGLTAVKELLTLLPGEDIVYLGDTGRVPYGTRSTETIIKYTEQAFAFLMGQNVKRIIVACGTVSSVALGKAKLPPVPVTGVVDVAAEAAVARTKNGKIGVLGTPATIASGAYEKRIAKLLPSAECFSVACPLFVPLVEAGRFQQGDKVVELVVSEYLEPLQNAGVDTVILGCTHYPLLADVIGAHMGSGVALINPGAEAVQFVASAQKKEGAADRPLGTAKYFVTDSVEGFALSAARFLQRPVAGSVTKIEIERG
ncbi:MAG TPA: glutamate racemase [Clostridiales bacterium]|nr:glutamate racemase [Clostridiales bacterium]